MLRKILLITSLLTLSQYTFSQDVSNYSSKTVEIMRLDGRPCLLFQLTGVSNVGNTGSPWIALKNTHPNFSSIVSILLSAKMADRVVHVSASHTVAQECGHAEATAVQMP